MKELNNKVYCGLLLDGRYKLLRPLSSDGGTADVWLAVDTNTIDEVFNDEQDSVIESEDSGIKVAIKIYRPKNALDLGEQKFREEFKIVFNCHHTNLVQPINFSIFEGIPYLVLPFCQKGSSERLQEKTKDPSELWRYISDVSAGLAYLHALNPPIVHHDIKPANVLIDDNNNYAITDFGISSHRGNNREGYDENQSGTMAYMAPERFQEDYESIPESDIWSFGATLYELITGKVPFGENGGFAQLGKEVDCPDIKENIPTDIKKLVYDCLSADISHRPSALLINKAANNKSYPLKKKRYLYIGVILFAIIISALIIFIPKKEESPVQMVQLSNEERFENAMNLVNSNDASELKQGMSILDTLSVTGYIPALYEQAYTYGWYEDSASISRKDLLEIEYYPNKSEKKYMPKEKQINIKAMGIFTRIEEIGDPNYPEINANALYRLACYYVNPNDVFKQDLVRAEILLKQALEWAEKGTDKTLTEKIRRNLTSLHE